MYLKKIKIIFLADGNVYTWGNARNGVISRLLFDKVSGLGDDYSNNLTTP